MGSQASIELFPSSDVVEWNGYYERIPAYTIYSDKFSFYVFGVNKILSTVILKCNITAGMRKLFRILQIKTV